MVQPTCHAVHAANEEPWCVAERCLGAALKDVAGSDVGAAGNQKGFVAWSRGDGVYGVARRTAW